MKVKKPWGDFINIWREKEVNVKIISVKPGSRLSLQSHKKRSEIWLIIKGALYCQIKNRVRKMKRGACYLIPKGARHRLSAKKQGGRIVEISFGRFDEKDIIRYEDDYGRIPKNKTNK
jgi:mannose-6-phosphate isomerase